MAGTIPADCLISCILGYPTLLPLGAADLLLTASFWQHEIINWLFTSLAVRSNVLVTGGTTISEVLKHYLGFLSGLPRIESILWFLPRSSPVKRSKAILDSI